MKTSEKQAATEGAAARPVAEAGCAAGGTPAATAESAVKAAAKAAIGDTAKAVAGDDRMSVLRGECERLAARERQLREQVEQLRGALADAGLGLEELALAADALMIAACLHFGAEQTTPDGRPLFVLGLPAFDARRLSGEYRLRVERDADDYRLTAETRGGGGLS